MVPTLKKKITSFLLSEEGKMPKHSLLSLGSFLSAAVISGVLMSKEAAASHTNSLTASFVSSTGIATAQHAHHSSSFGTTATTVGCTTGTTACTTY